MKTQNANKLGFNKNTLVELNDNQLQDVNGGSLLISIAVAAGGALIGAGIAYLVHK
ncbi:class IIb bacteriocin, lactobin A/cerein 7B family [Flavobacterium cerinum]|uniref:Class IIb bacteriocin, lactobin A/cerein 7B family n=1 Tax=Flavobacterium cerinum TaxID=2502784 RepID=A0ABY5ITN2_9FLAO|nr:class IIb bacteriocin, lactobin A/cerein 7B family [Flavobacterium cerinum]UUC46198.1 class IIb bacteriocin, lactobin A/cerein 7B family [Flavobacterium cerinum]